MFKVDWADEVMAFRRRGTPIIIVKAPDPTSVIKVLVDRYTEARKDKENKVAMLEWDVCRGIRPAVGEKTSVTAAKVINAPPEDTELPPSQVTGSPIEAINRSIEFMPKDAILFMINAQLFLEGLDEGRKFVIQAIWNTRDEFETTMRTLVLIVPDIKLPPELVNDVMIVDVPYPDKEKVREIVDTQFTKVAQLPSPEPEVMERAIASVIGLSEFQVKQVIATSLEKDGLNYERAWKQKKEIIRQVGGLNVSDDVITFDMLGGLEEIKKFGRQIIKGKRPPRIIVLWD